jgi:proline iminopeptidase
VRPRAPAPGGRAMIALAIVGAVLAAASCVRPGAAPARIAADSGHVTVPGARLFYKAVGRGEPIIIVHGGPGMDHAYLFPGMADLARSHRLVFYDQRGGGRTLGDVSRETVSLDLFLGDISALADSLRLGRFTLLGHSFGGLLALHYAARHPERLRALVLMNTVEPGRKFTIAMNDLLARRRTAQDSAEMQALMQTDAMRRRDTSAVNAMLRLSFRMLFADRALAGRLQLSLDPRTAANMAPVAMNLVGSMGTYDFWPVAARVRTPTLILHGADDAMPMQMLRELQQKIPGAELVLIERAGHFPYIEQPEATFTAIRRFLSTPPPPGR